MALLTFAAATLGSGCGTTMTNKDRGETRIDAEEWGEVDGERVGLYTLDNGRIRLKFTDYGATVTELHVPGKDGTTADIVLGFDDLEGYRSRSPYFGCTVGRVGNRIANGRFSVDGTAYEVAQNNGPHHLHGGVKGFDKVVWNSEARETSAGQEVHCWYRSKDGEEGYPGNLEVEVTYLLTNDDELWVVLRATTDRATPVNLVHHSYWNLAGHDSGGVLGQTLRLAAERYTPGDATLIPTGAIDPVSGTPFDFRRSKAIGTDIGQLPAHGADPGGYDVNFVIDGEPGTLRRAARAVDPASGRVLEILSDQAGIQFYSGNFLDGIDGKGDAVYGKHDGFCLETQAFPDAIHQVGTRGWPNVILRPGETYQHVMVHRFYVADSP